MGRYLRILPIFVVVTRKYTYKFPTKYCENTGNIV